MGHHNTMPRLILPINCNYPFQHHHQYRHHRRPWPMKSSYDSSKLIVILLDMYWPWIISTLRITIVPFNIMTFHTIWTTMTCSNKIKKWRYRHTSLTLSRPGWIFADGTFAAIVVPHHHQCRMWIMMISIRSKWVSLVHCRPNYPSI